MTTQAQHNTILNLADWHGREDVEALDTSTHPTGTLVAVFTMKDFKKYTYFIFADGHFDTADNDAEDHRLIMAINNDNTNS